jgi:hypothetical protein
MSELKYTIIERRFIHDKINGIKMAQTKSDSRHDATEKTVKIMLKQIVRDNTYKKATIENNRLWRKWVTITVVIVFISYEIGLTEALKLWLGKL